MKRVIFDTNIYGRMVENAELSKIEAGMNKLLVNYGSVVVKQELKGYEGRRTIHYEGKVRKFRALLLEAYDLMAKKTYEVDEKTDRLAEEYFIAYAKLDGKDKREKIINDFLIVATSCLHGLEVIYTEEEEGVDKTMRSPEALKAYEIVNELNGFGSSRFKSYEELRADLKFKRRSA